MSYVAYTNLKTPNEVIASMADYVTNQGYPIVQTLADDVNIYDKSSSDGKKFVFTDMNEDYFIMLRSANEVNIFGTTDDATMDITTPVVGKEYKGIGLTVGEGYSSTQRWYSQYNAPVNFKGDVVQCGWMPVSSGIEDIPEVPNPDPVDEPVPVEKPEQPVYPDAPVAPTRPTNPGLSNVRIRNINQAPMDIGNGYTDIVIVDDLSDYLGTDDILFICSTDTNTSRINANYNHMPYPAKLGTTRANEALVPGDSSTNIQQVVNTYGTSFSAAFGPPIKGYSYYRMFIPDTYRAQYLADCAVNGQQPTISNTGGFNYTQYMTASDHSGARINAAVWGMTKDTYNALVNGLAEQAEYDNPNSAIWQAYNTAYAQYESDLANYQQMVENMNQQYQDDLAAYQAYLQAKATYEQYLIDKAAYDAYIELINSIQHVYTLFCNHLTNPTDTLTFSLVKVDAKTKLYQTTHLIVGLLQKYDESWVGGVYFTGSATHEMVKTAYKVYLDNVTSDQYTLPVFSSSPRSNTFLRINIDEAPSTARGTILWASSGTDNVTGKRLSLPVRIPGQEYNGKIPHYEYLQSQSRLDWGRNINTLNCITVNMPLYFSVNVDPDQLNLYAAVGVVTGVFFVSTLNMQTGFCYEQSYPQSGDLCQVFPMGKRRGNYGFDGISIRQLDGEEEPIGD